MEPVKDPENILKLLKIAEDLLFSLPLPSDIIEKYETIRKKVFEKCDIPYTDLVFGTYPKIDPKALSYIIVKEIKSFLHFYDEIIENCQRINKNLDNSSAFQNFIPKNVEKYEENQINPYENPENCRSIIQEREHIIKFNLKTLENTTKNLLNHCEELEFNNKNLLDKINFIQIENEEKIKSIWNDSQVNIKKIKQENEKIQVENELFFEKTIEKLKKDMKKLEDDLFDEKEKNLTQETVFSNLKSIQTKELEIILQEKNIFKNLSEQLKSEIEHTKSFFEDEILKLKEEYGKQINQILENHSLEMQDLQSIVSSQLQDEKDHSKTKENQFIDHIEQITIDFNTKINSLQEEVQHISHELHKSEEEIEYYKQNLLILQEKRFETFAFSSKIVKKYASISISEDSSQDFDKVTQKNLQFLEITLDKLLVENDWLSDQSKSISSENKSLKEKLKTSVSQELTKTLSKAPSLFNDFEKSRIRLSKQLSKTSDFSKTYSNLSQKYL